MIPVLNEQIATTIKLISFYDYVTLVISAIQLNAPSTGSNRHAHFYGL